jgi:putative ABC transport system permease protein
VKDTGFYFSSPTVFLPMPLVQDLLFTGENVASAIMVRGDVGLVDDSGLMGVSVRTNEQVLADFDRILESSNQTLGTISTLLWVMAAGIVGAIVYVSVLERTRDLATLKAIGARSSSLVGGLVAQSSLIALISAVASVGVCRALAPSFGFPVTVPSTAYTQLVVVAAVVGVLASLTGVRKITRIDPALAFGGAS